MKFQSYVKVCYCIAAIGGVFGIGRTQSKPMRGQIIINRADGAWESQQVQEPCILPNPTDPSKLIMFYSGVPKSNRVLCTVGKAWATVSDPFTWHQDKANPVFMPSKDGWDSTTIRLDCVLFVPEESAYYIYYSGSKGSIQDHIGLAICPVGSDGYSSITPKNIKRFGSKPILEPDATAPYNEEMTSQSAVWREKDARSGKWKWFMYYSYRGKDGVLPGLRLATSLDGKKWIKSFNTKDPRGMGQVFQSTPNSYYEWHQIYKVGRTYVLSMEVGVERGKRWRTGLAVSDRPDGNWLQLDLETVLQTKWKGIYSDNTIYHIATPAFYLIGGKWYLYTQACPLPGNSNYIDGEWDIWCFECPRTLTTQHVLDEIHIPGSR